MKLTLHIPGIREMEHRQKWLSQPETMGYNAHQPYEADGYNPATGCIDFPIQDWRYWRDVWLWREPNRYSAYLQDEETGAFVGEACYYYDMESDQHGTGVLIEGKLRHQGYGTEGLKLLVEHAFKHPEVDVLFVELPVNHEDAVRMYLTAGFREDKNEQGILRLTLKRENA